MGTLGLAADQWRKEEDVSHLRSIYSLSEVAGRIALASHHYFSLWAEQAAEFTGMKIHCDEAASAVNETHHAGSLLLCVQSVRWAAPPFL